MKKRSFLMLIIMVFLLLLPSVCWGEGKKIGLILATGLGINLSMIFLTPEQYEPVKN